MAQHGEELIPVGYIRRAHGLTGAVLVAPLTDAPDIRYVKGARFSVGEDASRFLSITAIRSHKDGLLVDFEGVTGRNEAEALRGVTLTIPKAQRRPLEEGEFWEDDLIGLEAVGGDGATLGTVISVVGGPAQDRLVIETAAGDRVEVPFVDAIVREVLKADDRVVLDPPEGLF